jgi:hypothetical protein
MPTPQKVKWGKDRKELFRLWFYNELEQTQADRLTLEQKWANQVIQWRARIIGDGVGEVPFVGASDIDMPLIDMHFQAIYADFMQTLHIPKDFWAITPINPDSIGTSNALQEFLSRIEKSVIGMRDINQRVLLDVVLHGTGIYKDGIKHERKKVKDYNEAGEIEDVVKLKFEPFVDHVPLSNFYVPAYAEEIDPDHRNPWVAERFTLTKEQFKARSTSEDPFLPAYDKQAAAHVENQVLDRGVNDEDRLREEMQKEAQFVPWEEFKVELYEVWARYDVDGDGIEEDVVIVWNHDAREILRATHNPYLHGKRPFEVARYVPTGTFYGMGVADIDEWAQITSSRLLNSAIDSALLANSVMLGVPMGTNISPDEAIYPGKIWPLGPNERITDIRMGANNPNIMPMVGALMQFAEQRVAINEVRQGDVSNLPNRLPATTMLNALQEGNKRFDMIMGNLREGPLARIALRVLQNTIQISRDDPRWVAFAIQALGQQDGASVAQVLQGQVHELESLFGVSVTATSSKANKEMDKQNLVFLGQMLAQFYPQQLQYAQALGDQQLMLSTVQAAFSGITEIQKRLLEAHDIQNPEQYVPQQPTQAPALPAPQAGSGGPGQGPATTLGGPGGAAPLARAADPLAQILGGF